MKIVQLIPGSGNTFYCENCIRDNELAGQLRRLGHDVIVAPMYLPTLADPEMKSGVPIFFGGINVYLQQKLGLFRKSPRWLDRLFDAPPLLRWAAGLTGMTRAQDLADTTISMLEGEDGKQSKELNRLVEWLTSVERPDVVYISNALLLGVVRRIKEVLNLPVVCALQDETIFIDPLPEPHRTEVWDTMANRAQDVDLFIAVSDFYKHKMADRLRIPEDRIITVYNGIPTQEYKIRENMPEAPVIGFIERQCPEKGVHVLAEAFMILKERDSIPGLRLRIAGGRTSDDAKYVAGITRELRRKNLQDDVEFLPNLFPDEKREFLTTITLLSVPATHEEAFGLYIIESLASGVPVVQPMHGAFREIIEKTGGGVLYEPHTPEALADAVESLLKDPERMDRLGKEGRTNVINGFDVTASARAFDSILCRLAEEAGQKIK